MARHLRRIPAGPATIVVVLILLGFALARTSPPTRAADRSAFRAADEDKMTYAFRDSDDGRTLSIIDARAEAGPGKRPDLTLRLALSFTGNRIDPPSGYMHRPGANIRAARAVANGIEHGWLEIATRWAGSSTPVNRPADWRLGPLESIPAQRLDHGRLVPDAAQPACPTSVRVDQIVPAPRDSMSPPYQLVTRIYWRDIPRLAVEWSAARDARGRWTAIVDRIYQPPEPPEYEGLEQ